MNSTCAESPVPGASNGGFAIRLRVCLTILIRRALMILEIEASNDGSNLAIRHPGVAMGTFEATGIPQNLDILKKQ